MGGSGIRRQKVEESLRKHVGIQVGLDPRMRFIRLKDKSMTVVLENIFSRFSVTIKACDRSIDIPFEFGNDLNKYNATLGHKINHGGGVDTNSNLIAFDSPR